MTTNGYEELYVQYIYHFNVTFDYFECHEVLEELWLESARDPLLQGLLQVAVALHHHENGNHNGAIKLFQQAVDKLQHYPEDALGIDLGFVLNKSRAYLERLMSEGKTTAFEPFLIPVHDPVLTAAVDEMIANPPQPSDEH